MANELNENINNLERLFQDIRNQFHPAEDDLTGSDEEVAIKQHLRQTDPENAMNIAILYGSWYQDNKISPLKEKMKPHYEAISQGHNGEYDGEWLVVQNAREKFLGRLRELLPDWDLQNLLGENQNNVNARRTLVEQLSQAIENAEGEERDRLADAFRLAVAIQALCPKDTFVEYSNPIQRDETYRKWLCYLYLAHVHFDRQDILLPKELTDKEVSDRLLQSFASVLNDIIRAHNIDHLPKKLYHPENAPSCVPGAKGRLMLNGANYHKGLTFSSYEPVFNSPTKSIDSAIITKAIENFANGTEENCIKFLKTFKDVIVNFCDDLSPEEVDKGHFFCPFFDWNEHEKNKIVANLAMGLINDWTSDMSQENKNKVIQQYEDQIKAELMPMLEAELAKYRAQNIDPNKVTQNHWNRLIEGAFKKLFAGQNTAEEIINVFLEFKDAFGIMRIYFQNKGLDASIQLLNCISKRMDEADRLRFLTDFILISGQQGMRHLNSNQKTELSDALFSPESKHKIECKDALLNNLNWKDLSFLLKEIKGNFWKNFVLNSDSFLSSLLDKRLSSKDYKGFCEISKDLLQHGDPGFKDQFLNQAKKSIKKALQLELKGGKEAHFLNFILRRQESEENRGVISIAKEEWVLDFLNELKDKNQFKDRWKWTGELNKNIFVPFAPNDPRYDPKNPQTGEWVDVFREEDKIEQLRNLRYLQFLKNILIASGEEVSFILRGRNDDKEQLMKILLNPEWDDEESARNALLKEIKWKDLSGGLPVLINPGKWKELFIQNPAIDRFLNNILTARQYDEFIQVIKSLETDNSNSDTRALFINKSLTKIREILESEFNKQESKVDLLNFLLENQNSDSNVITQAQETVEDWVMSLQPSDKFKLLSLLSGNPTNLDKIRSLIITKSSNEEFENLLQFMVNTPGLGKEGIEFLNFIQEQKDIDVSLKKKGMDCLINMLNAIANSNETNRHVEDHIKTLLEETEKLRSRPISVKESQILYDALSANYQGIKQFDGYDGYRKAYEKAMKGITENMADFPWMKVVGYILIGLMALALLAVAALVIVALATPAAPLSMTILSIVGSIFTELSTFFTSVIATVSSVASTIFAAGTAATITAGAVSIEAAAGITAGTTGVAGILTGGGVGFFARRDVKNTESMEKIKDSTKEIHKEVTNVL